MATGYRLFKRHRKDGSHVWYARKRKKGHPERTLNTKTNHKTTADRIAREWAAKLDGSGFRKIESHTVQEAAERLAAEHFRTLKPRSVMAYEFRLANVCSFLGGVKLEDISFARLWDYEQVRHEDEVTGHTIGLEISLLSQIYEFAGIWEWCSVNPVKSYLKKRSQQGAFRSQPRTRWYTHDEEARLLKKASPLSQARIIFAIESGLRSSERFQLRHDNVNLRTREIFVPASISKTGKQRRVPLTERCAEAYLALHEKHDEFVFVSDRGDPWKPGSTGWLKIFQEIAERAGIPDANDHDLRRTCGCRLLQDRGLSIEIVRDWLGHSDIGQTQKAYAFLNIDTLKRRMRETEDQIIKIGDGNEDRPF